MSSEFEEDDDQFRIPDWSEGRTAQAPQPLADAWEPPVGEEWTPTPSVPLGDAASLPMAAALDSVPAVVAPVVAPAPAAPVAVAEPVTAPIATAASDTLPPVAAEEPAPRGPQDEPAPQAPRVPLGFGHEAPPIENTIKARGVGEVIVPPDCAWVNLGAEAQGATQEEARVGAAQAMHTVLDALKGLSVHGKLVLKTNQVSLRPVRESRQHGVPFLQERMPKVIGYRAQSGVTARITGLSAEELAAQASKVVDTAAKNGANNVGGVMFGLEKPEVAAREALKLAVQDARADAEALAEGAGVRLGALHSVCDDSGHGDAIGGSVMPFAAALSRGPEASVSTPIEAGDITVRKHVVCRWHFG